MSISQCTKCTAKMLSFWLKNGICGGCRNPDSIVRAVVADPKEEFYKLDSLVTEARNAVNRHMACGESLLNTRGKDLVNHHDNCLRARNDEATRIEALSVAQEMAAPKAEVAPTIKPGDLFVESWGATMRRVEFHQVVSVQGSKVYLGSPKQIDEEHSFDAGVKYITSLDPNPAVDSYAKIVRGKLKLCSGPDFKVNKDTWNTLRPTTIGKKESYYGD